jgi:hypothetical protein
MLDTLENLGVLTDTDVQAAKTYAKQSAGLNDPKYQQKMEKIKAGDAAKKSLPDQMTDADAKYQDRTTEDARSAFNDQLDRLSDLLQKMLDSGHATQQMENDGDDLENAYDTVNTPTTLDLAKQLSQISEQLANINTNITQQYETAITQLKGEILEAMNQAKAEADAAAKTADNVTDDSQKAQDGDTPTDAEPKESGITVEK